MAAMFNLALLVILQADVAGPRLENLTEDGGVRSGTLTRQWCDRELGLCLPSGTRVDFVIEAEQAWLTRATPAGVLQAWGASFAKGAPLQLFREANAPWAGLAEGQLATRRTLSGRTVEGHTRFFVVNGKVAALATDRVLTRAVERDGWSIPLGFELVVSPTSWTAQRLSGRAARGLTFDGGTVLGLPRLDAVTVGPGEAIAVTSTEPFQLGPLSYASGTVTMARGFDGGSTFARGPLAKAVALGALELPASTQVGWCEPGGLQDAVGAVGFGAVHGASVVLATATHAKPETCSSDASRGYELVLEREHCVCGGHFQAPPPPARVWLDGGTLDVPSARALERFQPPRPCPPCRGRLP